MPNKGMPGTNKLARVISSRMKKEFESPLSLDFAEIKGNRILVTNTFPVLIPEGSYTVCNKVSGKLKQGDRVLVAWVGNDAVVIDKIVQSEEGE